MKLYHTPGGSWAGTEKDWKAAMKAEGLDPKTAERKQVEVPTSKAELMEFLTFYNVRCIKPAQDQNRVNDVVPQPSPPAPQAAAGDTASTTVSPLPELFEAAPLRLQLDLAVAAIDRASERLVAA